MISININNETSQLQDVLVGIAYDFGGTPTIAQCYDPKSKEYVSLGLYPSENDCVMAMDALVSVLKKHNVNVYFPKNIIGLNQIFSRDIAFAIEDKLVLPNIIEARRNELDAIYEILSQIEETDIIKMPQNSRAEGGDVIVWNDYIFVGYSEIEDFEKFTVARTNRLALDFLASTFTNKKVIGFELNKSDDDSRNNALHLDCCFQPIGNDMAILYKGGFKHEKDYKFIIDYFNKENIIELNKEEMYNMYSNVFSISPKVIISDKDFLVLNNKLRKRGFIVEEVSYSEIGKMSGLFRCSTMPLNRF